MLYGLLYNRSSGFISCNKYFSIIAGVTNELFAVDVCFISFTGVTGVDWTFNPHHEEEVKVYTLPCSKFLDQYFNVLVQE